MMLNLGAQKCNLVLLLLALCFHLADMLALLVKLKRLVIILQTELLGFTIECGQFIMRLLENECGGGIVCLGLAGIFSDFFEVFQPNRDLKALEFCAEGQIFLCFLRLLPQRANLKFQFGDLVADTQKVVLGIGKAALCVLFPVAEFGNTCGLFKNFAAVGRFECKNLVDAALPDVGIALAAKAGVHEQFIDVLETGKLLVDIIFAFSGTEIAAGNHDLGRLDAKAGVGIVEHECRFGVADSGAFGCTAEDHVLHLRTAQRAGALLAEHPADSVGYIRFSAAVRADNGSTVAAELQKRLIREGLEALDLQTF